MIKSSFRLSNELYPLDDIRIIDGDTIEATIVLAFSTRIQKRIRLKGWWADEPEGIYAAAGHTAKQLLSTWCQGKILWLHSPSCRLDRYGRVVGSLIWQGQIVPGKAVLGSFQLTEAEHKARRDQNAAAAHRSPTTGYNSATTGGKPPYRDGAEAS